MNNTKVLLTNSLINHRIIAFNKFYIIVVSLALEILSHKMNTYV